MACCFGGISDAITQTECRHAKSAVKPGGALESRHRAERRVTERWSIRECEKWLFIG